MTLAADISSIHFETFTSIDVGANTFYLESQDECVIIDPSLVVSQKVKALLFDRKKTLKYILLTHIPSSHILGHLEFGEVEVLVGPGINVQKPMRNLVQNETIKIGKLAIEYRLTKNYSQESISFIVKTQSENQRFIIGGPDLIFGGGILPDLNKGDNVAQEQKEKLSLQKFGVEANTKVYPSYATNGYFRYIKDQSKTYSLEEVLNGPTVDHSLGPFVVPVWSANVHKTNKSGPFNYQSTKQTCLKGLSVEEFDSLRKNSLVFDIRQQIQNLQQGSILNSQIIPPNGNMGLFCQFLFKNDKAILIVCKKELRQVILNRLFNVGFPNILGFNQFTMQEWIQAGKQHFLPKFAHIKDIKFGPNDLILDCRTSMQWKQQGIVENAKCVYFPDIQGDINAHRQQYEKYDKIYVYCRMGYRARIGGTTLQRYGFKNSYIIPEPFSEIKTVSKIVPYQQK